MFTTNAALNYHCKSKHNGGLTNADGKERNIKEDNQLVETTSQTQTSQVSVKRANKRKIPKIVYIMPGKSPSDGGESKKMRAANSKIEIQSIVSSTIPIYIVDK